MLELLIIALAMVLLQGIANMSNLERLRGEVAEMTSAVDSAVVLISGLSLRIREILMQDNVEEALGQFADELDASQVKLGTSVAEGTAAAEDSDQFYDPAPIGYEGEDAPVPSDEESTTGSEATAGVEESNSSTSDETAESESPAEQPVETQTGGTDSADYAGTGAVSDDTAVDTSATTDEPVYGNGEGSEESASGEAPAEDSQPTSGMATGEDSTVSDEGNATDSTSEASAGDEEGTRNPFAGGGANV